MHSVILVISYRVKDIPKINNYIHSIKFIDQKGGRGGWVGGNGSGREKVLLKQLSTFILKVVLEHP